MTYSEIVQLLSTQMTTISQDKPRQVPMLEKYVNQMQIMRGLEDGGRYQETDQQLQ